jgi:hypothetical protein
LGWTLDPESVVRADSVTPILDVAVFSEQDDLGKVEVRAVFGEEQEDGSACADALYYGGLASEEGFSGIPDFKVENNRMYVEVSDSISYWCQQQIEPNQKQGSITTILYRFENTDDPLYFVTNMKTKLNL